MAITTRSRAKQRKSLIKSSSPKRVATTKGRSRSVSPYKSTIRRQSNNLKSSPTRSSYRGPSSSPLPSSSSKIRASSPQKTFGSPHKLLSFTATKENETLSPHQHHHPHHRQGKFKNLNVARKVATSRPFVLSDMKRLLMEKGKDKNATPFARQMEISHQLQRSKRAIPDLIQEEPIGQVFRGRRIYASNEDGDYKVDGRGNVALLSDDDESEEEEFLTDFSEEENDQDYEEEEDEDDDDDNLQMKHILKPQQKSPSSSPGPKRTKRGLYRRPRGISKESRQIIGQVMKETNDPAVIVNSAEFNPSKRRPRIAWSAAEVLHLRLGVERFGFAWVDILKCSDYKFNPRRTHVDLKDKWRNLTAYRPYGSNMIRDFILVDENHSPIINPGTGRPYHWRNRWPREAALKAAARNILYEPGSSQCTIFIREVEDGKLATISHNTAFKRESEYSASQPSPPQQFLPIVHVYEGVRVREPAPPHLAEHARVKTIWNTEVRKIREERYISQDDFAQLQREAHFRGM